VISPPDSFSLTALAALPIDHDPDPPNPTIGFRGRVSDEVREMVYMMRQEAQREAATPRCVKALRHLHDHIVGLAADIACEIEGTVC
jgi:hypothetical protein